MKIMAIHWKACNKILLSLLMLHTIGLSSIYAKHLKAITPTLLKQNDVVGIVAPGWWDSNEATIIKRLFKHYVLGG